MRITITATKPTFNTTKLAERYLVSEVRVDATAETNEGDSVDDAIKACNKVMKDTKVDK